MKKQTLFLLLTSLMLGSCQVTNNSESSTPEDTSSIEDTSSTSDVSSESNEIIEDSSSSGEEKTEPVAKEVKKVTDFLGSDNDVYRINITTEDGAFPQDKENYVNGSLNVTEQDTTKVKHEDMTMRIKLRGNSTLSANKKPFKIKFDSKQSLFGLQKAKDWVLLANYFDKSNVRNYLAYMTANKLTNLGFQPSYIFVDVYFNDQYYGLFLLTEQMEAKEGRVDIEDTYNNYGVNSFLLEADERAKLEYPDLQGHCYVSSGGYDFALKSPDADDYVEALENSTSDDPDTVAEALETLAQFDKDTAWLQEFMDKVTDAIESNDYPVIAQYVDVKSLIDYYLVQEFFKNVDVGSTSQYYVIDQSNKRVRLAAGPVWDFDIAAGVVDNTSPNDGYNWYNTAELFTRERDYYYNDLFKNETFTNYVVERYTEVRDAVFAPVLDELDLVIEALENAQQRNIERWPLQASMNTWIEFNAMSTTYYNLDSLQDHYDLLETVLTERLAIMDKYYLASE